MIRNIFLVLALTLLSANVADARNTRVLMSMQSVIESGISQGILDGSVQFYLAGQKTPVITKRLTSDVSNKKTNGFGKSDENACEWAMLSVLKAFQSSAQARGANAVVDMVSYYKKKEYKSNTDVECYAGAITVGVAMKGTYANTAN